MKTKRLIAFLLTLIIVISQVPISVFAKSDRLPEKDHEKFDFNSLEYVHLEEEEIEEIINHLNEISILCKDETNKDKVIEIVKWYENELLPNLMEWKSVTEFFYSANIFDVYWQNECNYINDVFTRIDSINRENLLAVIASPCKDALIEYAGESIIERLTQSSTSDSGSVYLSEGIETLVEEYLNHIPTIEYEGIKYTSQDILDACHYGEISYEEYLRLDNELKDDAMLWYSDVYLKLVNEYNKLSITNGYDSYLDYSYKNVFYRDFSPKENVLNCEKILDVLKPYKEFFGAYETDFLYDSTNEMMEGGIIDALGKIVGKIAPELEESYEYMLDSNGYLIRENEGKQYAVTANFRNIPFISIWDDVYDIIEFVTLVHEFGHYNVYYWNTSSNTLNLDLHEIYSHSLELISTNFFDCLFGDLSKSATGYIIGIAINEIYYTLVDILIEILAFSRDFESTEEFCNEVKKITEKYIPGENRVWYYYTQFFVQPGYNYSYVSSRLSALELYIKSTEDFDAAIDSYIKLISNYDLPTAEAIKKSGLTVNWTKKKLKKLFNQVFSIYADTEAPVIEGVEDGGVYTEMQMVHVADQSRINILVTYSEGSFDPVYETFPVIGRNSPIRIIATDGFGNSTEIEFIVEPTPFIIKTELNEEGKHVLSWEKYNYVSRYIVYGAPLGEKFKKLATIDSSQSTFVNNASDDRIWKYYVLELYDYPDGTTKKLASSKKSFMVSDENTKYTNVKSIEIEGDEEITLKIGETLKLPIKLTSENEEKKLYYSKKNKKIKWESSNPEVIKVENGKITALSEGTGYIYVYTLNGCRDKIIVHVEP